MEYKGPERRQSSDEMLIRIDERVAQILETLPKLATVERVDRVENKVCEHIENHKWSTGTIIAAISGFAGLAAGIAALFPRIPGSQR